LARHARDLRFQSLRDRRCWLHVVSIGLLRRLSGAGESSWARRSSCGVLRGNGAGPSRWTSFHWRFRSSRSDGADHRVERPRTCPQLGGRRREPQPLGCGQFTAGRSLEQLRRRRSASSRRPLLAPDILRGFIGSWACAPILDFV
jgi:hypothetical protein